jgi:hypothetical protein
VARAGLSAHFNTRKREQIMGWFKPASVTGRGTDLDTALLDAVKQHYNTANSMEDVESIVVEGDRGKVVITGRENIQRFLERYSK